MRTTLAALLTLLLTLPLVAEEKPCTNWCKRPEATTPYAVIIDANTTNTIKTKFSQAKAVEFIIEHKNPFRYAYRFDISQRPLEQGIAFSFLNELMSIPFTTDTTEPTAASDTCEADAFEKAKLAKEAAASSHDELAIALKTVVTATTQLDEFLQLTAADTVDCATACERAKSLRPLLATLTNLDPLRNALQKDKEAREKASIALATAHGEIKLLTDSDQRTKCGDELKAIAELPSSWEELATTAATTVEQLNTNVNAARRLAAIIDNLGPASFYEVYPVAAENAEVTLQLFRQDLRDEASTLVARGKAVVDVGTSRMSVSGGIGFSTINDATMVRQRAVDPTDATKIIEVFGEENDATFRPSAIALLNANIGPTLQFIDAAPALFSWSLGLAITNRDGGTDTEYITGPSIGFLENNIVFTLAYHTARVERLGGGFKIGQPIPDALQDPLPVEHQWEDGFMLGITYRFR